jgi:hypothetical protein
VCNCAYVMNDLFAEGSSMPMTPANVLENLCLTWCLGEVSRFIVFSKNQKKKQENGRSLPGPQLRGRDSRGCTLDRRAYQDCRFLSNTAPPLRKGGAHTVMLHS